MDELTKRAARRLPLANVMIPIHALLARIRWDAEYGRARFQIGYFDRKKQGLIHLPLEQIRPETGFAFHAMEDDGTVHSVPYHRVREVWRDGELIWWRGDAR